MSLYGISTNTPALAGTSTPRRSNSFHDKNRGYGFSRLPSDRTSDEVATGPSPNSLSTRLTNNEEQFTIDRFCDQCLQLESRPLYPEGQVLKRAEVQNDIFHRICADCERPPPGNVRFQLRILKELVVRIQGSIRDEEVDDYEVSESIMDRICQLVLVPQVSEIELAQMKCLVTYRLAELGSSSNQIHILENRNLIAARGGSGHRTWSGALYLGHFLCTNTGRNLIRGKRILELGAGTGYISILCAKYLGAAHVTASDGNEEVFENISENLALNGRAHDHNASACSVISPKLLKWGRELLGAEDAPWNGAGDHPIDLVLGADITYDRNANPALVSTLRQVVDLHPCTEVVISATERNSATWSLFRESCLQNQLRVEVLEYAVGIQDERLDDTGQSNMNCAPFYTSSAPMRIYRISNKKH